MSQTGETIGGLLAFLFMMLWIALIVGLLGLSVYGIILAFSASIILGIVSLIVEPSPLVFGVAMFFFHVNLPQMIVQWLSAHGG